MRGLLILLTLPACAAAQPGWRTFGIPKVVSFEAPPGLQVTDPPAPEGQTIFRTWKIDGITITYVLGSTAGLLVPRDLRGADQYRTRLRPIDGWDARWALFHFPETKRHDEQFSAGFHVSKLHGTVGLTLLAMGHSPAEQALGLRIIETARLLVEPPPGSGVTTTWIDYRHEPPTCRVRSGADGVTVLARDRLSGDRVSGAFVFVAGQSAQTESDGRATLAAPVQGAHPVEVLGNFGMESCLPILFPEDGATIEITFDAEEPS